MAKRKVAVDEIKWVTLQRLQYIELMAFYAGVITRSDHQYLHLVSRHKQGQVHALHR